MIANITYTSVNTEKSGEYAPNENRIQALNCSKTQGLLTWKPTISFTEGLQKMLKWNQNFNDRKTLKNLISNEINIIKENFA